MAGRRHREPSVTAHPQTPVRRFVLDAGEVITADGVVWPDGLLIVRSRADIAYSVFPGGPDSLPTPVQDSLRWLDE